MATFNGSARNDVLTGTSSADQIDGRNGGDVLEGGGGGDQLTGGRGADTFLYKGAAAGLSTATTPDTIVDFSRADGDKISFAGLTLSNGVGPLTWTGYTPKAGGVWQSGEHDKLFVDTTGDTTPDLTIKTQGAPILSVYDLAGVSKTVLVDSFSAYDASHWGNPFDGAKYWNNAFSWSAADVAVRNSEMQVMMTHHADGTWTAGGFNSFKAGLDIQYGTVDFDAKVQEAQGTMAAILMWPASDVWPGPEIDILETPQNDVMHTLHWNDRGNDAYSFVRNQAFNEEVWHHYRLTWLPNYIKIEVDIIPGGNLSTVAEWRDHIPKEPMGFGVMGFVGSPTDTWMGGAPDASTPAVVTVEVDNFTMTQWAWDGIA